MGRDLKVWAAVPMKSLDQSKSRLSTILGVKERAALSYAMLQRVMIALRNAVSLQGWMVVSNDRLLLDTAAEQGGHALYEEEQGLNAALQLAVAETLKLGGEAILVVPGDVPLLSSHDIDAIVSLIGEERSAVVAPSRRGDGTNALLLKPPDLMPFSFGPGSFEAHSNAASLAGAVLHIFSGDGLAFDVDTEDDWQEMSDKFGGAIAPTLTRNPSPC